MERKSGTDAWNIAGTKKKNYVCNNCMERKSVTVAWKRARTEILLSGTATWNGSLEQSWNENLRKHRRTWTWNGS